MLPALTATTSTPQNEPIDLKVKKTNPYLQLVQFPDLVHATAKETAELTQNSSAQEHERAARHRNGLTGTDTEKIHVRSQPEVIGTLAK